MDKYLIDRLQNFTLNRKIISIESDDRDIIKYPNANEFEVTCPQVYSNVESIRLLNIQIPNKLYNISEDLQNSKFKIQIFSPYSGMFQKEFQLNDGLYSPQQLASSLQFLINQFINEIPTPEPPPENNIYFNVEYNEIDHKFYFVSEVYKFNLIFSDFEYSNCYNKKIKKIYNNLGLASILGFENILVSSQPKNNVDSLFAYETSNNTVLRNELYNNFHYIGLPYNDPFRPHGDNSGNEYDEHGYPINGGTNDNSFNEFYQELSGILNNPSYASYINETQTRVNTTLFTEIIEDKNTPSAENHSIASTIYNDVSNITSTPRLTDEQLKALEPSIAVIESTYPVNLNENRYIYMEIEKYNTCDELIPHLTQKYTNVNNGTTNSYFAKIPIIKSEHNQSLSGNSNYIESLSYYQPPIEKIAKFKFKFRYHNGIPVNFHNYNISFDLEINQIRNEIKNYDVRKPFIIS